MARWRRLERKGSDLVRCAEVTVSTKGETWSEEKFLAVHPHFRKEHGAGQAYTMLVVEDSASIDIGEMLAAKSYERDFRMEADFPLYSQRWAEWVAAGRPDSWKYAYNHITHQETSDGPAAWSRGRYDKFDYPRVETKDPETGLEYIDYFGVATCEVTVAHTTSGAVTERGEVLAEPRSETSTYTLEVPIGTRVTLAADGGLVSIAQVPDDENRKFYGMVPVKEEGFGGEGWEKLVAIDDPDIPEGVDYLPGI